MNADLTVSGLISLYRLTQESPLFSSNKRPFIELVERIAALVPSGTAQELVPKVNAARSALDCFSQQLKQLNDQDLPNDPFVQRIKNIDINNPSELIPIIKIMKTVVSTLLSGSTEPVQDVLEENIKNSKEEQIKGIISGLAGLKGACNCAQQIRSAFNLGSFEDGKWIFLGRYIDHLITNLKRQNSKDVEKSIQQLVKIIQDYDFKADLRAIGFVEVNSSHQALDFFKNLNENSIEGAARGLHSYYEEAEPKFDLLSRDHIVTKFFVVAFSKKKPSVSGAKVPELISSLLSFFSARGSRHKSTIGNLDADLNRINEHREAFLGQVTRHASSIHDQFFQRKLPNKGTKIRENNALSFEAARSFGLEEYEYQNHSHRALNVVEWLMIHLGKDFSMFDQSWERIKLLINSELQKALVFAIKTQMFSVDELVYVERELVLTRSVELEQAVRDMQPLGLAESQKKTSDDSKTS